MRNIVINVVALIIGFLIGITLSEVIGIMGVLGSGRAVGIKYLPVYTAIISAILANLLDRSLRNKSKKVD